MILTYCDIRYTLKRSKRKTASIYVEPKSAKVRKAWLRMNGASLDL